MTTVDQFLKALAVVESSDDPEAWGDGGRAMGRWQVHPDRYEYEIAHGRIQPKLGDTWDQRVETILRTIWAFYVNKVSVGEIAMYWHVGHWDSYACTNLFFYVVEQHLEVCATLIHMREIRKAQFAQAAAMGNRFTRPN